MPSCNILSIDMALVVTTGDLDFFCIIMIDLLLM